MKNLFKTLEKKLEKYLIGYNTGELTASQISEITGQCRLSFENRVAYQIRELETLIVATGKEHKTNIIFTIPEKEDPKVFDKALNHFKEKGFTVYMKNLKEEIGENINYVIISWKTNETRA